MENPVIDFAAMVRGSFSPTGFVDYSTNQVMRAARKVPQVRTEVLEAPVQSEHDAKNLPVACSEQQNAAKQNC
jgi:hypothetical protein